VLIVIGLLRSMGWRSSSDRYAREAAAFIAERYGPVGDAKALSGPLKKSVEALLETFPESLASLYPGNNIVLDILCDVTMGKTVNHQPEPDRILNECRNIPKHDSFLRVVGD